MVSTLPLSTHLVPSFLPPPGATFFFLGKCCSPGPAEQKAIRRRLAMFFPSNSISRQPLGARMSPVAGSLHISHFFLLPCLTCRTHLSCLVALTQLFSFRSARGRRLPRIADSQKFLEVDTHSSPPLLRARWPLFLETLQ